MVRAVLLGDDMPVNRKRVKRDHTGGLPDWFIHFIKTGNPPIKDTPDDDDYCVWWLFAGAKVNGIDFDDADSAKKRREIAKKLGI